jgi:MoaA/NifB/PqqE/SkfB family radical SAM enzyme
VGFQRVSISLDGPDQETHDGFRRMPGAFTQAVDGFLRLKELGMAMQVNTTVTLHNREQLNAIYALVRKLGAVAWHLFLLVPVGCGQEIAAERQLTPRAYEEVLYWIEEVAQEEAQVGRWKSAPPVHLTHNAFACSGRLSLAPPVRSPSVTDPRCGRRAVAGAWPELASASSRIVGRCSPAAISPCWLATFGSRL